MSYTTCFGNMRVLSNNIIISIYNNTIVANNYIIIFLLYHIGNNIVFLDSLPYSY